MFQYADFFGNVDVEQSIDPENYNSTTNGSGVDCRDADGVAVIFTVGAGASLATANNYELIVQHSDDDTAANFADVAAGDLVGADGSKLAGAVVAKVDAATKDDQAYGASYVNSKRYVRCVAKENGSGASVNVGAVVLRYRKQYP